MKYLEQANSWRQADQGFPGVEGEENGELLLNG